MIADGAGNLFGTTNQGGSANKGTVFKLAPDGTESVLYSFSGGADGAYPQAGLTADKKGNFYGTAASGSNEVCNLGCGVVFELKANGRLAVLHSFSGDEGDAPLTGLTRDKSGNLYGTTWSGGSANLGVVFKIASDGTYSVLHDFGGADGSYPLGELLVDSSGNLYGSTTAGGSHKVGTLFKVAPDGAETVLFNFARHHGTAPIGSLAADRRLHHLYGVTQTGGSKEANDGVGAGVVFSLTR